MHANDHQDCRYFPIARSAVGAVLLCPSCGVVHIHLQHVTLRFEADAFSELVHMVMQADTHLAQVQAAKNECDELVDALRQGTGRHAH